MKNQRSYLLLMLLFSIGIFHQVCFAQGTIFLNKYKRPIKDVTKYEPRYFQTTEESKSNIRVAKTFNLDSVLVQEKVEYLGKKGNVLQYSLKDFDQNSWAVIRVYRVDNSSKSTVDSVFHSNGILAALKRTANWQLVEEKRWDNSGNPLDLGLFREASIVGGPEAWDNFLASNLNYPSEARSDRAEGMVYLAFQLDEEGRISEIEVMNPEDVHPALANEALRVMKKYQKNFSPKVENGNLVKTEMYLPIRFTL